MLVLVLLAYSSYAWFVGLVCCARDFVCYFNLGWLWLYFVIVLWFNAM